MAKNRQFEEMNEDVGLTDLLNGINGLRREVRLIKASLVSEHKAAYTNQEVLEMFHIEIFRQSVEHKSAVQATFLPTTQYLNGIVGQRNGYVWLHLGFYLYFLDGFILHVDMPPLQSNQI